MFGVGVVHVQGFGCLGVWSVCVLSLFGFLFVWLGVVVFALGLSLLFLWLGACYRFMFVLCCLGFVLGSASFNGTCWLGFGLSCFCVWRVSGYFLFCWCWVDFGSWVCFLGFCFVVWGFLFGVSLGFLLCLHGCLFWCLFCCLGFLFGLGCNLVRFFLGFAGVVAGYGLLGGC